MGNLHGVQNLSEKIEENSTVQQLFTLQGNCGRLRRPGVGVTFSFPDPPRLLSINDTANMKEQNTNPQTVPYGFGCTCGSEKVIFCYNKRTGQKTWSCSGKCFELISYRVFIFR
ncbi:uncharacterized protein LOC116288603 [Actinia tenebrosa]|uniref:Uncharacterized protein LOC116288603 n=1 Tax=Actinia tenebrosa TaxID=6105 RepID=A0A6P8H4J7_ACTTE|nr:uncharacterized protein LOC116288603 [Actinia tenebrosa]